MRRKAAGAASITASEVCQVDALFEQTAATSVGASPNFAFDLIYIWLEFGYKRKASLEKPILIAHTRSLPPPRTGRAVCP